jgi:hypothetical protein
MRPYRAFLAQFYFLIENQLLVHRHACYMLNSARSAKGSQGLRLDAGGTVSQRRPVIALYAQLKKRIQAKPVSVAKFFRA